MTALKSLFFLILLPGLLMGYCPYLIAASDSPLFDPGVFAYLAFSPWLIGWTGMLLCF